MDTSKVTRVEVINYVDGKGRVYSIGPKEIAVSLSFQDGGTTLKVFIDKREFDSERKA